MRRILLCAIAFLVGCADGIDCPIDTPSCCYNVLFGCGPFDLPSGCSCSGYGFAISAREAGFSPRAAVSRRSLNGTWSGTLQRNVSSCGWMSKRLNGAIAISVKPRTKRITVKIPGYTQLTGTRTKSGFSASGSYRVPFYGCSIGASVNFRKVRSGIGSVTATATYRCGTTQSCTARYSGTLQQW